MEIQRLMPGLKVLRSYPQPDSPALGTSPRNRALAVFKYLLGLEPEQAIKHELFKCVEHAFFQEGAAVAGRILDDSFVEMLDNTK